MPPKKNKAKAIDKGKSVANHEANADATTNAVTGTSSGQAAATTVINSNALNAAISAITVASTSTRAPDTDDDDAAAAAFIDEDDSLDSIPSDEFDLEGYQERLKAHLQEDKDTLAKRQKQLLAVSLVLKELHAAPIPSGNKEDHRAQTERRERMIVRLEADIALITTRAKDTSKLLRIRIGEFEEESAPRPQPSQRPPSTSTGIKLPQSFPRFVMGKSAHDFVQSFRNNVLPTMSQDEKKFRIADYIIPLVQDSNQQSALNTGLTELATLAKEKDPNQGLDMETVEKEFYRVCREPEEKRNFLDSLRNLTLQPKEKYRQLAQRIDVARTKVDGTECDQPILSRLAQILPDHARHSITVACFGLNSGKTSVDWNDLVKVNKVVQEMEGPDYDKDTDVQRQREPKGTAYDKRDNYHRHGYRSSKSPREDHHRNDSQHRIDSNQRGGTSHDNDRKRKAPSPERRFCAKCGRNASHTTEEHKECHHCGKKGHVEKDCYQKRNQNDGRSNTRNDHKEHKDNRLEYSRDHDRNDHKDKENDRTQRHYGREDRHERKENKQAYSSSRRFGNDHDTSHSASTKAMTEQNTSKLNLNCLSFGQIADDNRSQDDSEMYM
ncbi:hypothetical protein B0O80DRAFT_456680 [Mortierella sp. GBAus27b]|nr:hypothetical protein BGX31_002842 [Mortierella sp. GBA43]KAI8350962.1 hypothetical protein B0O80DRAFT_456680 [Mortierella sp. GBAus27b]